MRILPKDCSIGSIAGLQYRETTYLPLSLAASFHSSRITTHFPACAYASRCVRDWTAKEVKRSCAQWVEGGGRLDAPPVRSGSGSALCSPEYLQLMCVRRPSTAVPNSIPTRFFNYKGAAHD